MIRRILALVWLWMVMMNGVNAQTDPATSCRVEDGRLIFVLDTRWSAAQKAELAKLFSLDSALVAKAFRGFAAPGPEGSGWSLVKIDANLLELSKPLQSAYGGSTGQKDVAILDDSWIDAEGEIERESVPYGINKFTRFDAFGYRDGIVTLFLPGYLKAREVYLSGSFNDWSTMRAPMEMTDSGWVVRIRLQPGKYTYKYIIDGRWTPDPHNRQQEDDTYGSYNSVFFCYNFTFYLRGYQGAQGVTVAGSFNGWNGTELRMQRVSGGWIRAMYLREGTHAYKFVVDRTWILDPANKVVRPDGTGHENSFISIGDPYLFRLSGFQDAEKVVLTGNFNAWNTGELLMQKSDGGWTLPYVLAPGNYEYKFIIDGRWAVDEVNPYSTGSGNYENSFLAVKPNHLFYLDNHSDARKVIVTGSFNGWNGGDYRMVWNKDKHRWEFPLFLKPGKHTYKFNIDGKWILDPANTLWEDNEYGTGNSVLWIEPGE